jgi:DNA-binding transcriptional MerR regulator
MHEISALPPSRQQECFDLAAAAELSGMHPEMILEFTRARLIRFTPPEPGGAPRFDNRAILRLRQIQSLRHERAMSLRSIRLVVGLLERLDAAEAQVRSLRGRLPD